MPLILRSVKGSKLTTPEMDGNLTYLASTLSGSIIQVTGSSIDASNTSITASSFVGDGSGLTNVTSSYAATSSYSTTLIASAANTAIGEIRFRNSANTTISSISNLTASLATSASYAISASIARSTTSASYATTASYAATASFALNANTASYVLTSSYYLNGDGLEGVPQRTIFSRNSDTTYTSGISTDVDFLSGSVEWGSRNIPQTFLDNSLSFSAKILHFRAVGKFTSGGGNDTNFSSYLSINNQIISGSDIGVQVLSFSTNKPFEILGEIIITAGSSSCCYSISYCDQTGDLRRTPLGDVTISGSFADLTPGDLKIIISGSTNRSMTSYYSYVQVLN